MKKVVLRESTGPYTLSVDDDTLVREPVILERDGRPVAVVLPIAAYEEMCAQLETRQQEEVSEPTSLVRDRTAFLAIKEQLMESHLGQYVAFKDGQFLDADLDDRALVRRLYDRFGVVPLYVKKVEEKERVYRIPGPRRVG